MIEAAFSFAAARARVVGTCARVVGTCVRVVGACVRVVGASARKVIAQTRSACIAAAVVFAVALPARGQVVDTTDTVTAPGDTTGVVAADSLEAGTPAADTVAVDATDTLLAGPPVGFGALWSGAVMTDSLPARLPHLDLVELLATKPAGFGYRFNSPGWPDGWSYRGLPPHSTGQILNYLPFSYLFSGRPAHQLVPLAVIEQPEFRPSQYDRPATILARIRPFVTASPVTEGKYWKGGDGLQSIDALHAQHRRTSLFGRPGYFNVLGAYAGRAADGEYPGSRLRRSRQVLVRGRFQQSGWSLELFNLHNRRNVGAHGGVVPETGNFESIYIRPGATVENPDAWRRIVRNDLAATFRFRLLSEATAVGLFWTAETFRYRTSTDTLGTRSDRLGVHLSQPLLRSKAHSVTVQATAWHDEISPRYQFASGEVSSGYLHASVRDTFRTGGWDASLEAGFAAFDVAVRPVGSAALRRRNGVVTIALDAALSEQLAPAVAETGFGSLSGMPDIRSSRILHGGLTVGLKAGAIDFEVGAFASRRENPIDYFAVADDSAAVLRPGADVELVGGSARLGWRRRADRGLYASIAPTAFRFIEGIEPLGRRITNTLPELSGRARIGARFVLFEGDLDVDAYVVALAWSSMRSRRLHPETGLLTVPDAASPEIGPSSMINVVAEAAVRSATLFLVYENVLSGTELMRGNLLVPVYPLPERRFRFGVYWPIFG